MKTLDVVVGGQYGSEAKGHVTARIVRRHLAQSTGPVVNVRVAGPNAGHTVIDDKGQAFPLRSIPVGAVEPDVKLQIAAGSEVDLSVVTHEVRMLAQGGHSVGGRLWIHPEATLLTSEYIDAEIKAELTTHVGSTGKGIGAARSARLMRKAKRVCDSYEATAVLRSYGVNIGEYNLDGDASVVIEGTQGYGLGLHAGHYPHCTSSDCTAIDFMAMARISPWMAETIAVWVVFRPYPIRVAGNSGPMHEETTWQSLGLEPEFTTVTKKMRRVGRWDNDLARAALKANGAFNPRKQPLFGVSAVMTMADQVTPQLAGVTDHACSKLGGTDDCWTTAQVVHLAQFVHDFEERLGYPISMVTTGPNTGVWL